ncbi:hypothetical protein [Aeromicrobium chenweiae]|uniref:Uncharacterized protein n=1 Tax=Aeromicrobium chenweiae TaxID=2079793 RepID=A0A2S0WMT1_9ACTN|nr:hypothetical protein [Aeromicrobium chenweiae]AWB92659.1 hypothetical protein C3E78_10850 [Aeromicrobium chenweiae]TGN33647.1 hypothetical protein E4L97_00890 [Aeromicrobium chenweiae]
MDFEEPGWPLIDNFFVRLAEGRKAETVRRYARVRLRLYDFLDVDDMIEWLGPDDATLLAAEREFLRDGAVWTVFGLGGVLRCLPGFLTEAQLPTSGAEARMQVSVVSRFVTDLRNRHLVPREDVHALLVARRAAMRARDRLQLEQKLRAAGPDSGLHRAIAEIDRVHERFRQQPGPQW